MIGNEAADENMLSTFGYLQFQSGDYLAQTLRLEPSPSPWYGEFNNVIAFAEERYDETLAGIEPQGEMALDIKKCCCVQLRAF